MSTILVFKHFFECVKEVALSINDIKITLKP